MYTDPTTGLPPPDHPPPSPPPPKTCTAMAAERLPAELSWNTGTARAVLMVEGKLVPSVVDTGTPYTTMSPAQAKALGRAPTRNSWRRLRRRPIRLSRQQGGLRGRRGPPFPHQGLPQPARPRLPGQLPIQPRPGLARPPPARSGHGQRRRSSLRHVQHGDRERRSGLGQARHGQQHPADGVVG